MTQICDDKFKGKLTRGLKNDIRNLVKFSCGQPNVLKICTLTGSFCPNHIKF